MQPQHVVAHTFLRAERADARSVKQRVRLQALMPAAVGRALRYAKAPRPPPTDSDICKWQKQ
jgi:hypothetical protein